MNNTRKIYVRGQVEVAQWLIENKGTWAILPDGRDRVRFVCDQFQTHSGKAFFLPEMIYVNIPRPSELPECWEPCSAPEFKMGKTSFAAWDPCKKQVLPTNDKTLEDLKDNWGIDAVFVYPKP